LLYNGDIGSGKLPLNLQAMEGHKMTSPNSEYFFEKARKMLTVHIAQRR